LEPNSSTVFACNCLTFECTSNNGHFIVLNSETLPEVLDKMPKMDRGVYSKNGMPLELNVHGLKFSYMVSGQTRMVYSIDGHPDYVAKIMPGSNSPHWKAMCLRVLVCIFEGLRPMIL